MRTCSSFAPVLRLSRVDEVGYKKWPSSFRIIRFIRFTYVLQLSSPHAYFASLSFNREIDIIFKGFLTQSDAVDEPLNSSGPVLGTLLSNHVLAAARYLFSSQLKLPYVRSVAQALCLWRSRSSRGEL